MIISCKKKKVIVIEMNEDEAKEFTDITLHQWNTGGCVPDICTVVAKSVKRELEKP